MTISCISTKPEIGHSVTSLSTPFSPGFWLISSRKISISKTPKSTETLKNPLALSIKKGLSIFSCVTKVCNPRSSCTAATTRLLATSSDISSEPNHNTCSSFKVVDLINPIVFSNPSRMTGSMSWKTPLRSSNSFLSST